MTRLSSVFAARPWTVATYMAEGGGSPDQRAARLWAYRDPAGFGRLVEMLVEASIDYLAMPGGGRRRRAADFRYLGRQPAAARSSRPGWSRRRGESWRR